MSRPTSFSIILCFIVVTIATTTLAAPYKGKANLCCPPDQLSTTVFSTLTTNTHGTTTTSQSKFDVNMDYGKKRIAARGSSNTHGNFHYIVHPNITYVIDDTKMTCVLNYSIPFTYKQCVPDTAVSMGTVTYGSLKTTGYTINVEGYNSFLTLTDECLAVNVVEAKSSPEISTVKSEVYSNIQAKVDESAFIIPSFCPKP